MSGGRFDYLQCRITEIIEGIEEEISNNNADPNPEEFWYPNEYRYSEETIAEFRKGISLLKKAQIYAQRIDWLVSGDDSEETFHKRLFEDLKNNNLK